MNVGITINGDPKYIFDDLEFCRQNGIKTVQLILGNGNPSLLFNDQMYGELQEFEYIFHTPFWFSFFSLKMKPKMKNYLLFLEKCWLPENGKPLKCVSHVGAYKHKMANVTRMRFALVSALSTFNPMMTSSNIELCLENTAGSMSSFSPDTSDLDWISQKRIPWLGFCFDTEHAYAAGEDVNRLNYWNADIIHLNGIPPYVLRGGHLDRHSWTPLRKSKEVKFINKVIEYAEDKPLVLERYDHDVVLDDIEFLKNKCRISKNP